MHPRLATLALLLILCASSPALVHAQNALRDGAVDTDLLSSDAFQQGHPDLRFRNWAEDAYRQGDYVKALRMYQSAARYADKVSQGRVAEMYWAGEGVARDQALAYAWMDLAAERGYRMLLAIRERYWAELTAGERERAIEVGQGLYAEYGDAVAKPRLEKALFKARRQMTGSRTGSLTGNQTVTSIARGRANIANATNEGTTFRAERFYDETYWKPELYWAWQAKVFDEASAGKVRVGDLKPVRDDAPGEDGG